MNEMVKIHESRKLKDNILGIPNRAFSELLKVKDDIYSHLLSQHTKDRVARC